MAGGSRSTRSGGRPARSRPLVVRDARDSDVPELLEMFVELAEYEDLLHELQATEKQLSKALFGPRPAAEALIAELDKPHAVVGYALLLPHLLELPCQQRRVVGGSLRTPRPPPRGRRQSAAGRGRSAPARARRRAPGMGGARLERTGAALYSGLRAQTMPEWITHRLTGDDLNRLAALHPSP